MKIYLAGSSADATRIALIRDRLVIAGVEVTSTWLDVVTDVGAANPRGATRKQRWRWATSDLAEIHEADLLWFLVPPLDKPTRGAWLEVGVAVTAGKLVVCSGDTAQSIFCALGDEYTTDEEAFAALVKS